MRNNLKLILGITALFMALLALSFLLRNVGLDGVMSGGWHRPVMENSHLFGSFMWLAPLGLLFMVVYGVVRFTGQPNGVVSTSDSSAIPTAVCPHCDQVVQEDWTTCPHCDSEL